MSLRIELCASLFERKCPIGDLPAFDRDTHPLADAEMRRARHRRRQTDTETVAPLPDIENGHDHDLLLRNV